MPSDANGVYSLPGSYLAVTGELIQASQHNPPLEDLAAAQTARLMRSGVAPMTGALRGIDGAAATPSFTFNSAQTTGWYKTAGGNIGISIGGTETVEFGPTGVAKGARYLGELIPWTGSAAPALCVLPFGQTLLRATYPDLWTFAQAEIAAGNTLYNNGNGTTTFGVPDLRGRVLGCKDNMGGSAASRLTSTTMTPDGNTLGAVGGAQTKTLLTANLPPYTPAGTIANGAITINNGANVVGGGGPFCPGGGSQGNFVQLTASQAASTFTGNAQGGTSTPVAFVPPTLITNFALFAGA
jgi:microcystin-dependent protein